MKKKIVINTPVWGKTYIKKFKLNFINFLIKEIESNKFFYKKYDIKLEIWTFADDIKDIQFIEKINLFRTEFVKIDLIKKNYSLFYKRNKYQFLNILQNFSLTKNYHDSEYILFLYPDFIWNIGSIKNVIKRIKNKDAVCVYCPQTIEENFTTSYNYKNINKFILNNLHPIITNHSTNNSESISKFTTGACISYVKKNGAIFKNFHLHPICIKLKNINIINKFHISLDEDFIINCKFSPKNIYIPKNSKEMMFSSLLTKKFYTGVGAPLILDNIIGWGKKHCNPLNIYFFSKNFYLINKKRLDPKEFGLSTFFKLTNKIYRLLKISLKEKSANYFDVMANSLNYKITKNFLISLYNFKKFNIQIGYHKRNDKFLSMHNDIVLNKTFNKNLLKKNNDIIFANFLIKNIYKNFF